MVHPCLHRREMWPEQGSFTRHLGPAETRELPVRVARMERPRSERAIRGWSSPLEVPAFRGDGGLWPPNCLSLAELLGGSSLDPLRLLPARRWTLRPPPRPKIFG